jgi:hypothetical protein
MSAKLKACPFCGAHLKKCVFDKKMFYEHPDVNGCALSQMLFTEKQWNTRPVEEALEAENARLKNRINLYRNCLHRAQKLYYEKHPDANGILDGAENIEWLIEQIKMLERTKLKMR